MSSKPALIGVDWGTTNLRVHRIDGAGAIIDSRHSALGILNVPAGAFAGVLEEQAGDWLSESPGLPVLACGMVGSRQGWLEVPYVPCPVSVSALAGGLRTVTLDNGRTVHLVAGASWRDAADGADVIRGEETTIVGAMCGTAVDGLVCLPGTHAKWAWVNDGELQRFRTSMSGELYQVMMEHSILGRMAAQGAAFDASAFARGVARSAQPGGLLHHLFGARSLRLFDALSAQQAPSYLSGLIVGADVRAMCTPAETERPLTLIAEGASGNAYAQAFNALQVPFTVVDGNAAVAAGLLAVARAASLIASAKNPQGGATR